MTLSQVRSHPWLGLLLTKGRKDILYSQCAATLVGKSLGKMFPNTFLSCCRSEETCSSPLLIVWRTGQERFRSPLNFLSSWESTIGGTLKTPSKDIMSEVCTYMIICSSISESSKWQGYFYTKTLTTHYVKTTLPFWKQVRILGKWNILPCSTMCFVKMCFHRIVYAVVSWCNNGLD